MKPTENELCLIFSMNFFQDIHSQGEVIACLEKWLVSEVEDQPGHYRIKEDCKKSIMRVAELSSDDFHLDRHLFFACRDDRERFCENVRVTLHICGAPFTTGKTPRSCYCFCHDLDSRRRGQGLQMSVQPQIRGLHVCKGI